MESQLPLQVHHGRRAITGLHMELWTGAIVLRHPTWIEMTDMVVHPVAMLCAAYRSKPTSLKGPQ